MATPPSLCIEQVNNALREAEIGQHAVEVHGALVGLICGGVQLTPNGWQKPLSELMNDGQALPKNLEQLVTVMYQDSVSRLAEMEFGFTLLLPDEEETLASRLEALSLWVQSFLTGLAIIQPKLKSASAEVREVIDDLSEIARVELEVDEDEESEAALMELVEFVRMAAMLCYSEFGTEPEMDTDAPQTLH
ncbi:UPF0149 family protein [Shewanella sp. NIFS-20-20]|uniref:UPF0149 family protein n=1 Tax=Shewanella sp. NIFS-20-20 TaxID=2853806 RepID=UPI001C4436D8|nr:UPF0149 family protein [Shewanella sp. NIFS-20-20]MBV7317369.1 UPF0149 family protein [Shewanella sp. NIFS-20-20]